MKDALTEYLRQETSQLPFAPLPLHYVAVAKLLLEKYVLCFHSSTSEDIPSSSRVRALLKDLREARQSKILAGLPMLNPAHLEVRFSSHAADDGYLVARDLRASPILPYGAITFTCHRGA